MAKNDGLSHEHTGFAILGTCLINHKSVADCVRRATLAQPADWDPELLGPPASSSIHDSAIKTILVGTLLVIALTQRLVECDSLAMAALKSQDPDPRKSLRWHNSVVR